MLPPPPPDCSAVCVPPGARLLVHDIPEDIQNSLKLQAGAQQVVFTQIGTSGYRDAIRFQNGVELLLQRLVEGQHVRVLALSSEEAEDNREWLEVNSCVSAKLDS